LRGNCFRNENTPRGNLNRSGRPACVPEPRSHRGVFQCRLTWALAQVKSDLQVRRPQLKQVAAQYASGGGHVGTRVGHRQDLRTLTCPPARASDAAAQAGHRSARPCQYLRPRQKEPAPISIEKNLPVSLH
jgi:hypothetical protein